METPTLEVPAVNETPVAEPIVSGTETDTTGKPEFDPKTIPPEIQEYFKKQTEEQTKKYADYDKYQAAAAEWEGVKNDQRFQKWTNDLRSTEVPKQFEITDEQFTAALSDKGRFLELVNQAAERLLADKVGPQLQSISQQHDFQAKANELSQTVSKYPDFKDLDQRGLIEPILRRYPGNKAAGIQGITFEDAYKLAKHSTLGEDADKIARGIVSGKKAATVERPGSANGARSQKVNAKNREEAMNMVAEALRNGRPVPEFDEIGG